MDKAHLDLVKGGCPHAAFGHPPRDVERAVGNAIRAGYRVGKRVRIGCVAGRVVGYNIGAYGCYDGAHYPLLVRTRFGVAKCSLSELAA